MINKFTNENVKKERKRLNRNIILIIPILIIGLALGLWANYIVKNARNNVKSLNEIIIEQNKNKEDKIAKVNVHYVPYQFAVQEGNVYSYYIIMDKQYMYIAYLPEYKFNELNKEDIKENPVELKGRTRLISREIKELAIDAYNEAVNDENKITMADFDDYFGSVYLEATATYEDSIAEAQKLGFLIFTILGIIGLIITIRQRVKFGKSIKNMDNHLIEKINNEMNDKDAFYYDKVHLYLTKNYVINFQGIFKVIEYNDIIWMYSMQLRTNGIKTAKAINIMSKNGKVYTIANIDILTKSKKELYDEIWNTITSKNSNIVLGYTKEAANQAKQMIEKH